MNRLAAALLTIAVGACGDTQAPIGPSASAPTTSAPDASGCARTSIGAQPLMDLRDRYKGEAGGLYAGGSNTLPGGHLSAGLSLARAIAPLDASGRSSASGRYAFVSIGMSNTTQEFSTFKSLEDGDPAKHPQLTIVDGAQGGVTASDWAVPSCPCWSIVDERLAGAGVTPTQVVAAWVKLANANPTEPFPIHADILSAQIIAVLQILKARMPNVRLAYLSSRIYAGYATTALNPEPYAYESGFAVRNVIAAQIGGDPRLNFDIARGSVRAPWLAWGPYLWADGLRPRSDGLTWACGELGPDGTHPSDAGRRKVADMLISFVKSDATASTWFGR